MLHPVPEMIKQIRISGLLLLCSASLTSISLQAQPETPLILSMRERAAVVDAWLKERLETVVPDLMRRNGIDMWIVSAREYNEDPVIRSMLPATWISARRRTILVYFDHGPEEGLERLAVSRYDIGEFFPGG